MLKLKNAQLQAQVKAEQAQRPKMNRDELIPEAYRSSANT